MNPIGKITLTVLISLCISCVPKLQTVLLKQAHAHNDYEHEKPLFDALENGFLSVEVDVHLIDNTFYVSHDTPTELTTKKSLETLYLDPLNERIKKNDGTVYPDQEGFFYLMIDIKTAAEPAYQRLQKILENYESIIARVENGKEEKEKPLKIVITGHHGRPYDQIVNNAGPQLMSVDGRPEELGKNISAAIMPYISDNYHHHLSYTGEGSPSKKELLALTKLVDETHREGKKLRFWAAPDNKTIWNFLLAHQVDLINTDHLKKFHAFMREENNGLK